MPTASYSTQIAKRGDAARGILQDEATKQAAVQGGVPVDKLSEISQAEQEAKAADLEQRKKQQEAKQRNEALEEDFAAIKRDYTEFRQRRETRKAELTSKEEAPLLAALTAEYARKIQIERTDKTGKTTTSVEESEAIFDRLTEISRAVGAVLMHSELVKSFEAVAYGEDKLGALKKRADDLLEELKEIQKLRKEAEASTQREQAAAGKVNELWKLYGPSLRRVANKNATIKALLQST